MRLLVVCSAVWHALALRAPQLRPPHRDVGTSSGVVRGYLARSPPHYAFLGLPYARPPPAYARFQAADAPVRWDGVFEATYRVRCAQLGQRVDAACLVLNVFAPEHGTSRPVLVHLHDGHFATGWGSHSGPSRLLNLGFVVVTLNYRLGAEGFLCLGTSAAPGNAGLKDQVAALSWVHENIDKFGGDSSQVTLHGTGTGAAAAELLLLSGAIDGYIQRVILESGSALAPTSLAADPVAAALDVATQLGYEDNGNTIDALAVFYQNIAVAKTLNHSNKFAPCVESLAEYYSALLIKDPKEILQRAIFKPVPLLIAYSKERFYNGDDMFHNVPKSFKDLLPNNLEFGSEEMKFTIGEVVKETYFHELETGVGIVENFENYINDVFTVYPIVKSATLHVAASSYPAYLMEFVPREGTNTIFDYIFSNENLDEEEELIAQKLVAMWSNFLTYSDPTPLKSTLLPVVWLPVTFQIRNEKPDISSASCLVFHLGQITMSMGMPSSRHTLPIWDHIYDNFYKSHTPKLELSESDVMLFNEEIAFISKMIKQPPGGDYKHYNAKTHNVESDDNVNVKIGSGANDDSDSTEQVDESDIREQVEESDSREQIDESTSTEPIDKSDSMEQIDKSDSIDLCEDGETRSDVELEMNDGLGEQLKRTCLNKRECERYKLLIAHLVEI